MKIKRFNNLWAMGLILCGVLLIAIYLIKIICPEFVIEISHNENIVKIGKVIDSNKILVYITSFALSFFVLYLTCCACCQKKYLSLKECLVITILLMLGYLIKEFLPKQYTIVSLCIPLILPLILKGKFSLTIIHFVILNLLQTITLEIRNLSTMVLDFNFATLIVLMIDYYITIILLYFAFNSNKKEE